MFFLDSRFLLYEYRHKLTEQLKHDVHALLTCFHIIKSVTHGKEHRLHSSSVRCGVELRVTLGDVTDTNKVGSGLKAVDALLKAFKSRYTEKAKMLFLCQFVLGSQLFEERSGIPVYINKRKKTIQTIHKTLHKPYISLIFRALRNV